MVDSSSLYHNFLPGATIAKGKVGEWAGTFTPIWDCLAIHDGINVVDAAVYGRVWRFCQMGKDKCWASHSKLALALGVTRRTVLKSLKKLVRLGLLKKIDTGKKKTNIYTVTRRIQWYQVWAFVLAL